MLAMHSMLLLYLHKYFYTIVIGSISGTSHRPGIRGHCSGSRKNSGTPCKHVESVRKY